MSANHLRLLFSSQLFQAVPKKNHSKNKVTETHSQIWKCFYLNNAQVYGKKSLKCVIKPALQTCAEQLISVVELEMDTDTKSTPIWIAYHL